MSPHDSLAVHPDRSERSPTLPSSSGLCVRQIENEQQSTVGGVSQPLKVMALARPLAVSPVRSTLIHFYFGSVQFSVKRKFVVSVRRKFRWRERDPGNFEQAAAFVNPELKFR